MSRTRDSIAKQALEAIAAGSGMYGVDRKDDLDWAMNEARRALAAMDKTPVSVPEADVRKTEMEVRAERHIPVTYGTMKDDWRPPQPLEWQEMPLTNDGLEAQDYHHRYTIVLEENGYVLRRHRNPHGVSNVLETAKNTGELQRFADDLRTEESKT